MTAEATTERSFYRFPGPDTIRRDPPHRYLPVGERENWREQGIDMPSILLRDPEKLPVKILLHSMYGGEIGGSETFGRRYVHATKEGVDSLPWELALVNSRLVWDECRHTEIVLEQMANNGVTLGDFVDGYVAGDTNLAGGGAQAGAALDMINSMASVHRGRRGPRDEPLHRPHRHGPEHRRPHLGARLRLQPRR